MRAKKNILNDLFRISPDDTDIIKEVWAYSIKNECDIQDEFWDMIPEKQLVNLTDKVLALMKEGPADTDKKDGTQAKQDFIDEFIDPSFKVSSSKRGATYYEVVDGDHELEEMVNGWDLRVQHKSITKAQESCGGLVDENFVKACVNRWSSVSERIRDIEPFRMPDEAGWTLFRPKYAPDDSIVDLPAWFSVLERMSDHEAFLAWIWGVYSGKYGGRKVLWLYGDKGEEGKSTISSLLGDELFGPAQHTIDNSAISAGNRNFLNAHFEGARLVLYPDCNVANLILHENFKSLTSGGADKLFIEHKGAKAYTGSINAYAWVCSNLKPLITRDGFVTSRTLLIKIEPFKDAPMTHKQAKKELRKELPGLLAMARDVYNERCPDNYDIRTNDATKALEAEQICESTYSNDVLFDTYFVTDGGGAILKAVDLNNRLDKAHLTKYEKADFFKYLTDRYGSEKKRRGSGFIWTKIRLKGVSNVVSINTKANDPEVF